MGNQHGQQGKRKQSTKMGRNRPPEARADRQGPGRVDVTSAQEILDKRTRLVLFSVARVTKFADKDGGEKGPVPCLSVIYLIERLDGKEVHVRQTGGIDILVPGTTDWAASWSGNGGEKASNYAAYPGVAGAIDRPAARDPKNAQSEAVAATRPRSRCVARVAGGLAFRRPAGAGSLAHGESPAPAPKAACYY